MEINASQSLQQRQNFKRFIFILVIKPKIILCSMCVILFLRQLQLNQDYLEVILASGSHFKSCHQ